MNEKLAELLAQIFGLRVIEIRPDLQKCEVGTWDSLMQMDLVVSLEQTYGIELEISDVVRMTSVEEIMAVLRAKGVDLGR